MASPIKTEMRSLVGGARLPQPIPEDRPPKRADYLKWPINVMAVGDKFKVTAEAPLKGSKNPRGELHTVRHLLSRRKRLVPGFDYKTERIGPPGEYPATYLVTRIS